MLDTTQEKLISLAEASKLLPVGRNGKPAHLSCILRWITQGAPGQNGERVRLDGARIGARWITSREAIQRFAERLTPRIDATKPPSRTIKQRTAASARAAKELEQAGI